MNLGENLVKLVQSRLSNAISKLVWPKCVIPTIIYFQQLSSRFLQNLFLFIFSSQFAGMRSRTVGTYGDRGEFSPITFWRCLYPYSHQRGEGADFAHNRLFSTWYLKMFHWAWEWGNRYINLIPIRREGADYAPHFSPLNLKMFRRNC